MIRVSAPGKTILMGEHAAVYGHPVLVAAIDRRLEVVLDQLDASVGPHVRLDLPQLGVRAQVPWSEIHRETVACRAAWDAYRRAPSPQRFAALASDEPTRVVRLALGEAAHAVGITAGGPALALGVRSEIPVGAGFGSSAAVAVAVGQAFFCRAGAEVPAALVAQTALEVERRQHGAPSGADSVTVQRGGLLWVTRALDGALAVEGVRPASPALLAGLEVFDTGTPAETTGTVVAAVRARRERDPEGIEAVLETMAAATRGLRQALETARVDSARVIALFRSFESGLERLGVVPPSVRSAIRGVEAEGAAAKISGAGALSGYQAGSLLVYHGGRARASIARHLAPFSRLAVRLGAQGVRRETE